MPNLNRLWTMLFPKFLVGLLTNLKRCSRTRTQMKATGEVMAIGRNIEESLLKAVRSLEIGAYHNELAELSHVSDLELTKKMVHAQDDRLFYLSEAIRRGYSIEELQSLTKIDLFFLDKLLHIIEIETTLESHVDNVAILKEAKQNGFSDRKIAKTLGTNRTSHR